jgi:hypothetical protein
LAAAAAAEMELDHFNDTHMPSAEWIEALYDFDHDARQSNETEEQHEERMYRETEKRLEITERDKRRRKLNNQYSGVKFV